MIVTRVADDQFPCTFFARLDLDFGTDLLGQFLLEARDVAVGTGLALDFGRGVKDGVDQVLRLPRTRILAPPHRDDGAFQFGFVTFPPATAAGPTDLSLEAALAELGEKLPGMLERGDGILPANGLA